MVRAETRTEACEPTLGAEAPCIVFFESVLSNTVSLSGCKISVNVCLSFPLEVPLFLFAPMSVIPILSFVKAISITSRVWKRVAVP